VGKVKKKTLWRIPATIVGIVLGLIVGGLTAAKELVGKRFPVLGLIITVASPVVIFIFEEVMRMAFPETYREKIAGTIFWIYRFIINDRFRIQFIYELRFPLQISPNANAPQVDAICEALNAKPGGDPEPDLIGANYVDLRFSAIPGSIVLKWFVEEPNGDATNEEEAEKVFTVTMRPEIRDFVLRSAQSEIEALSARILKLYEGLVTLMGTKPKTQTITVDAWLGSSKPPATPIPPARKDRITQAEYRLFPGLVHLNGSSLATLSAVYRYIKILEPPPESNNTNS
jgi:hypothetical protein